MVKKYQLNNWQYNNLFLKFLIPFYNHSNLVILVTPLNTSDKHIAMFLVVRISDIVINKVFYKLFFCLYFYMVLQRNIGITNSKLFFILSFVESQSIHVEHINIREITYPKSKYLGGNSLKVL